MEEIPKGSEEQPRKLTLQDIEETIKALIEAEPPRPNHRELVLLTGPGGYEVFDRAIQRAALENLLECTTFSPEERARLKELIHSDDWGNFTVADELIKGNIDIKHETKGNDAEPDPEEGKR